MHVEEGLPDRVVDGFGRPNVLVEDELSSFVSRGLAREDQCALFLSLAWHVHGLRQRRIAP